MRNIVGKFEVELGELIHVKLQRGAKPLHFNMHNGILCLWALIDLDQETKDLFVFRLAGTGHPIGQDMRDLRYMNTVMWQDLVFHFFEICSA